MAKKPNKPGGGKNEYNTITGSSGDDELWGTDSKDNILGNGGNDILHGGDEADVLEGGTGNDTLFGDTGNDKLSGDRGNDRLIGGDGNDELDGGRDYDTAVFSGSASDYTVSVGRKNTTVEHNNGGIDGTDTLKKIEALEFADTTIILDGTNNAPVAYDDTASATEDGSAVVINVLDNDWDFEGDTLSLVITSALTEGSITDNGDGTVSFDPGTDFQDLAAGATRDVSFNYTVSDGLSSDDATVTITVTGTNDAPTVEISVSGGASDNDGAFNVNLLDGATDVDLGDTLSVSGLALTGGDDSGVTLNGNSLDIDPSAYNALAVGDSEIISYSYNVIDGNGGSVSQTASITISGANDAPTVTSEVMSTSSEDSGSYSVDLLAGSNDAESPESLNVSNLQYVSGDTSGVLPATNKLDINPNAYNYLALGQSALIVYSYNIVDGDGGAVPQTASITITGANDAPTVSTIFTYTAESTPITANFNADDVDSDDDASSLTYEIMSGPSVGEITVNNDGTFTFDDQGELDHLGFGESQHVTFTYQATDSHGDQSETSSGRISVSGDNLSPRLTLGTPHALGKNGTETQVNSYTSGDQNDPAMAHLAYGGYVIVWASDGQDGSETGIFGQRYDADGNTLGAEFQVNADGDGRQYAPSVAALDDGGFVVTWSMHGTVLVEICRGPGPCTIGPLDVQEIVGQRFDYQGNRIQEEFEVYQIAAADSPHDLYSSAVALDAGGFAIVYSSYYSGDQPALQYDKYDSSGNQFGFTTDLAGSRYFPGTGESANFSVTEFSDGGFATAWIYEDGTVFSRAIRGDGTPTGIRIPANPENDSLLTSPSVAETGYGAYIVTWVGLDGEVYGQQIFNSGGISYIGDSFQFSGLDGASSGNISRSFVTGLTAENFVVLWTSLNEDGSGDGLFGQRIHIDSELDFFNPQLEPIGDVFQINGYSIGDQNDPAIVAMDDGGFLVTWVSDGQDGAGDGIFSQHFDGPLYEDLPAFLEIYVEPGFDYFQPISVSIAGVPEGATLSAGEHQGDGSWTLTSSDLGGLLFTPPDGFAGQIDLTVTATATNPSTGETGNTSKVITLIYAPVNDVLVGDDAANTLFGGAGDDDLSGLLGEDVLIGGNGDDTLSGGGDGDTFVYSDATMDGHDVIVDLETTDDVIDLDLLFDAAGFAPGDAVARGDALNLSTDGTSTTITVDDTAGVEVDGFSITVANVSDTATVLNAIIVDDGLT